MSFDFITKHDSPNYTRLKNRKVDTIVIHHWGSDSATFDGVVSHLTKKSSGVSAHFVVEAGKVACLVNVNDVAWHAGNFDVNKRSIGIECAPKMTSGDYRTLVELVADLYEIHGALRIVGHRDVKATVCPGRWYKRIARIRRDALALVAERSGNKPQKSTAKFYTIKRGDTLSGIAGRFNTTVKRLAALNRIPNPDKIKAGAKIRVK